MNLPEWSGTRPTTLGELFTFYHGYVKVLYGLVQNENALPQEMLFEVNAALDHISRIWTYSETEADAVGKAFSHFKRSCLDVFKILVKVASSQYKELTSLDTSAIDNGEFDRDLHALWREIKVGSTEARSIEGQPDGDRIPAFDKWEEVAANCLRLQEEFFFHPQLAWAKRKVCVKKWSERLRRWAEAVSITLIVYAFLMPTRLTQGFAVFAAILLVLAFSAPKVLDKWLPATRFQH